MRIEKRIARNSLGIGSCAILAMLVMASESHAAKIGRVTVDEAIVYQSADTSSKVLARLQRGQPVAASDKSFKGFHRVRTKTRVLGWMLESDLRFTGQTLSRRSRGSHGPKQKFRIRGSAGLEIFKSKELNDFLGDEVIANALYFGVQIHYRLSRKFSFGPRLDILSKSQKVTVADDSNATTADYTVSVHSMPIMLGGEYQLTGDRSFALALAGDVGIGTGTKAEAKLTGGSTPSVIKSNPLTFMIRLLADLQLSDQFALSGELGYRMLNGKKTAATLGDGGSLIFGATAPELAVQMSGPMIGVGLAFKF